MANLRIDRIVRTAAALAGCLALTAAAAAQPRFFPDDPLRQEPRPVPVVDPQPRAFAEILEGLSNSFGRPGERQPERGVILAGGVNTLDEVMDGDWFENRHGLRRLPADALARGAGNARPPAAEGPWEVVVVKPAGLRPGLLIADAKRDLYLLRFDPGGDGELVTGAEMVTARFYHALGYHVGETYLVRVARDRLATTALGQAVSSAGQTRPLVAEDIDNFLRGAARRSDGTWRAVALRIPVDWSRILGPYQVFGTRSDDPNDVVPHEHRRDLRGLFVFAAWLNHTAFRAVDTADLLVETGGVIHIRHHLVDLGKSLGASMLEDGAKRAWEGRETFLPGRGTIAANALGLGFFSRDWMRSKAPGLRGAGRLEWATFDPERWTTYSELAPFANRLPDDTFWAAKQVLAFTDDDIRTIVAAAEYSDPKTAEWIATCLIERRKIIGRAYLGRVLPLDRVRMEGAALRFDDLAAAHGFAPAVSYTVTWHAFDNAANRLAPETIGQGAQAPPQAAAARAGTYFAARITGSVPGMLVSAYLRGTGQGLEVVGVERAWPGRVVVDPAKAPPGPSRYPGLSAEQRDLFVPYAAARDAAAGQSRTPQQAFDDLSRSEQTTFDGITHALSRSTLTDEGGRSLGRALDLVESVERIAGQYAGRRGDQQYRLYVRLKPGAKDTLERSREFYHNEDNTVFHVGYPYSFRQAGKEPTMQISISDDGAQADVDVDYRSSKSPQSLFNGHLSSANSDVRAGDNPKRHNGRWSGFVAWWQATFGRLGETPGGSEGGAGDVLYLNAPELPTPLPPDRAPGAAPEKLEDAVQEFLTDWLVRRKYDEALQFLSSRAFACVNLKDQGRSEPLNAAQARAELQTLMSYAARELGERKSLTEATAAVQPPRADRQVATQPYSREFSLFPIPEDEARPFLCGQAPGRPEGGQYFAALVTLKKEGSGVLGMLWSREGNAWRLVAYRVFGA